MEFLKELLTFVYPTTATTVGDNFCDCQCDGAAGEGGRGMTELTSVEICEAQMQSLVNYTTDCWKVETVCCNEGFLNLPTSLAIDSQGVAFICDFSSNQIIKQTPSGQVSIFVGEEKEASPLPGYLIQRARTDTTNLSKMSGPCDIKIDSQNNFIVSDCGGHKIRKITPDGQLSTLAGGKQGLSDEKDGLNANFNYPNYICIDADQNIFVCDGNNHRIRKISPNGEVTTFAGSEKGFADGKGSCAMFNSPYGIVIDKQNNIYVSDCNNHKIRKINPEGEVSTFAGSEKGYSDGRVGKFNEPRGLAMDNDGNILVADTENNKIRRISAEGEVTTLAGSQQGYLNGHNLNSKFYWPYSVCVDKEGNIFVCDSENSKIRKMSRINAFSSEGEAIIKDHLNVICSDLRLMNKSMLSVKKRLEQGHSENDRLLLSFIIDHFKSSKYDLIAYLQVLQEYIPSFFLDSFISELQRNMLVISKACFCLSQEEYYHCPWRCDLLESFGTGDGAENDTTDDPLQRDRIKSEPPPAARVQPGKRFLLYIPNTKYDAEEIMNCLHNYAKSINLPTNITSRFEEKFNQLVEDGLLTEQALSHSLCWLYTQESWVYQHMNNLLRDDSSRMKDLAPVIKGLMDSFKFVDSNMKYSGTVYRQSHLTEKDISFYIKDNMFMWSTFSSATKIKPTSNQFGDVLFEIQIPEDKKQYAIDLERFSSFTEDVLLLPNIGFIVEDVLKGASSIEYPPNSTVVVKLKVAYVCFGRTTMRYRTK